MSKTNDPRIIVALDFPSDQPALALADQLDPAKCRLKVGKELFTRSGPELVRALDARGFEVFLDLKFHDIPNTTAAAVAAADLSGIGISGSPADQVSRLATLTRNCGLDGVVCSAQEAPALKSEQGADFKLVTPGIRPLSADPGDQQRIMTPTDAMRAGSDYLVIGRPITQAADPLAALEAINSEVASA